MTGSKKFLEKEMSYSNQTLRISNQVHFIDMPLQTLPLFDL